MDEMLKIDKCEKFTYKNFRGIRQGKIKRPKMNYKISYLQMAQRTDECLP